MPRQAGSCRSCRTLGTARASLLHYRTFVHAQVATAIATILVVLSATLHVATGEVPVDGFAVFADQARLLALPLSIAVLLAMIERGRSSDLIMGAASRSASSTLIAAVLKNTVEQTLLACLALVAFLGASPFYAAEIGKAFAWLFLAGRVAFMLGYWLNPMWRFYGFSINFYSSVLLLGAAWFFALRVA